MSSWPTKLHVSHVLSEPIATENSRATSIVRPSRRGCRDDDCRSGTRSRACVTRVSYNAELAALSVDSGGLICILNEVHCATCVSKP